MLIIRSKGVYLRTAGEILMYRFTSVLAISIIAILAANPLYAEYKLVWSDEFYYWWINKANFSHEIYPGVINSSSQKQYYTSRSKNSFVRGGKLAIQVDKEKYDISDYTSARLSSYDKRDFLYGKIEARIKVAKGRGLHSEFRMMPTEAAYGTYALSGQIEIMNFDGEKPSQITSGLAYGAQGHSSTKVLQQYVDKSVDLSDDYHVYAVEWQPSEMRWFVDGNLYATQTDWHSAAAPFPAPFDKEFYLVLNVSVEDDVDENISWPQQMLVDWIRVYQVEGKNIPPKVELIEPQTDAHFETDADIVIKAEANDPDGNIAKVEFYEGNELLGEDRTAPYTFGLEATDGCYVLMARAVDNDGFGHGRSVEIVVGEGCPPEPFHGEPMSVPGRIEAEDFDLSTKELAYYDIDPGNNGGGYRNTGVDIQECQEGGFNIGWMEDDEWLDYTVDVKKSGTYTLALRVASPYETARVHVEFAGENKTGTMAVPQTGDWQNYRLITKQVRLAKGRQIMRLFIEKGGFNLNYIQVNAE